MTPEERRAKSTEYMRKWRAANPDKAREAARRHMAKWRAEHPDEARSYTTKWKSEHPDTVKATSARSAARMKAAREANPEPFRKRDRGYRARYLAKWAGMPETAIHEQFATENPTAVSMDRVRPDFYIPGDGFVEIKRALPHKGGYGWSQRSEHFPGLFFLYMGTQRKRGMLDMQIALQPKPLTVIVYHALTGEELARKTFHQ